MSARRQNGAALSRRELLKRLGLSAALAPFVPLLNASGQEATLPRRLVLFFTPHGTVWKDWRPQGGETDFTLSRILKPLEPFQKKLVVLDGIGVRADGPGAPHTKGSALLFTASPLRNDGTFTRTDCEGGCSHGWNSGPSFDQVMARRLTGTTPFRSLEFGAKSGGGHPGSHVIYAADNTPIPARQDPVASFRELFGAGLSETNTARVNRQRRAALGIVGAELSSLEQRVARADRSKVQRHREALEDLSSVLFRPAVDCALPPAPNAQERPEDAADSLPWHVDRQVELLAAALRCDLTRIASLQIRAGEVDGYPYRYLGLGLGHHLTSHDTAADKQELLTGIYEFYAKKFAYLLKLLDQVPEGDGTMLDNTLVLWGSEVGTGATHDFTNVPFVLAGGGAHGVRTGRYLVLPAGTYHNRLLVSAMRYLGASDVETFGSTDQERGSLPGLGV